MNKFFKYTFIALLGVLTLGLSSCTDEYEYTPTSKTELGGNAFLVSEGSTAKSFLPEAEQSFTFKVSRIDSTEAQTVGLSVAMISLLFLQLYHLLQVRVLLR